MKAFVTGGTGFIGSHLIKRLLDRGDQVTALVRSERDATALRVRGVTPVVGDIRDMESMREGMVGSDVVFHTAAWYKVGAKDSHQAEEINVQGTRNVLSLAHELGVPRIIYTSTIAVYGNTHGRAVNETMPAREGPFATEYDRTKWMAHYRAAVPLIEQGAPVIIVQPGAVYGPGDKSWAGQIMEWFIRGFFPVFPASDLALQFAHVDDVVEGHLLAAERGRTGESYILAGPPARMRDIVALWARLTGRPEPLVYLPSALVALTAPLMGLLSKVIALPDLLSEEAVRIVGSTYLGVSEKARRELGWQARSIEEGMAQTLAEVGNTVRAPEPEVVARRFRLGQNATLFLIMMILLRLSRRRK